MTGGAATPTRGARPGPAGWLRVLAALLTVAAAAVFVPAGPASATEQPRLTIAENQTIKKTYAALNGSDPGGNFVDPDSCRDAVSNTNSCDVIPLTIVPPSTPQDFVVSVELHWEAQPVANGAESTNDMALYLWDDPQGKDPVVKSDGSSTTERVGVANPKSTKYQIVANNFLGRNTGYTITVTYLLGGGNRPDESLDPTPTGGGGSGGSSPPTTVVPASPTGSSGTLGSGSLTPSVVATPAPTASAGSAIIGADPNFLPPASEGDLGSTLAAPRPVLGHSSAAVRPPRPVSGITVALSLLATPLAIAIVTAAMVVRRRVGHSTLRTA